MNKLRFFYLIFIFLSYSCSFEVTRFTSVNSKVTFTQHVVRGPVSLGSDDCFDRIDDFLNSFEAANRRVLSTSFIKKQCEFGSCWTHAGITLLEKSIVNEFDESIELSSSFVFQNHIKEQIEEHVLSFLYSNFKFSELHGPLSIIKEKADLMRFNFLIKKYGVMPEDSFKYRPFETSDPDRYKKFQLKLYDFFKNLSHDEDVNKFKERYVNINNASSEDVQEFSDKIKDKAFQILFDFYIEDKKKFTYLKNEYSPHSFLNKLSLNNKKIHTLHQRKDVLNIKELERALTNRTEKNKFTFVNIFWHADFVDYKTGNVALSNSVFESKLVEETNHLAGHAVIIIGFEKDRMGDVKRWIIQNSFGEEVGDKGVFYIDSEYFNQFIRSVHYISE